MKTYYIKGVVELCEPLHIGAGEAGGYIDSPVLRDGAGVPFIPATTLAGIMASVARRILAARGHSGPDHLEIDAFTSLFGAPAGDVKGRQSSLFVYDAALERGGVTHVQHRNSIDRERGSAQDKHLFRDEVVARGSRFSFSCELREIGEYCNAGAFSLLLAIVGLLTSGFVSLGGKKGTGRGRFSLKEPSYMEYDRSDPDDILAFALGGLDELAERKPWTPIAASRAGSLQIDGDVHAFARPKVVSAIETIAIEGVLRPLDPILVRAGFSADRWEPKGSARLGQTNIERLSDLPPGPVGGLVDATFCAASDESGVAPYLPGSSLRGSLRARLERMVRTLVFRMTGDEGAALEAAWPLDRLESQGKELRRASAKEIYENSCLVSRLFGFSAMGGRISVSDAIPVDVSKFKDRLKLVDSVAIDRFTGGAADGRKFNARPYFPYYADGTTLPDDKGDMRLRITLEDFELWHLGALALLLNDLCCGRILVGYGKTKGYGRVRLLPGSVTVSGLAVKNDASLLHKLIPMGTRCIGGYYPFEETIDAETMSGFWCSAQGNPDLYTTARAAIAAFRAKLADWCANYRSTREGGA